ncbi:MAG: hypothetical protein ACW980_24025 [Promethearchaeota archaeon]|jgi:hypothetical protein
MNCPECKSPHQFLYKGIPYPPFGESIVLCKICDCQFLERSEKVILHGHRYKTDENDFFYICEE